MANINIDSRILTNVRNDDIVKMINNVIDAELEKDVSRINTDIIDECVDLLIEIEKANNDKFNSLIPLMSSDKFLHIITHKKSGWKNLNIFARTAVIAAVIAGSTFSVNAAVKAVTDVNLLEKANTVIIEQLMEWGIIDTDSLNEAEDNPNQPGITDSKGNQDNMEKPDYPEKPSDPKADVTHIEITTEKEEATTSSEAKKSEEQATKPSSLPVVPVTKNEESTTYETTVPVETTAQANAEEPVTEQEATTVKKPIPPTKPETTKPDDSKDTTKAPEIISLSVNSEGMKKQYTYNEEIDYTGIKLYAKFSDGSIKEISIDDTTHTKKVNTTNVGEYTLRITYKKCTVTVKITIRPDDATSDTDVHTTENYEYVLTDDGAYITKYMGSDTRIELDEIEGNSVYAIGNGVFRSSNITYFSSNTVRKIFENAFDGCEELEFSITPCVEYIGENAYRDCEKLNEASFAPTLSYIGAHAYEKTSITSLTLPDSISEIPEFLCNQCARLETVNLNESIKTIGKNAFNECTELISVTGTRNITKVDEAGFYNDQKAEFDSNLPMLEYAGKISFAYCKKINFGKLSENIKHIEDSAFQYCYLLNEVNIPSCIKEIPFCAFQGAHITKLTFEEGVEKIGEYAFMSTNFTSLVLPDSLKSIGTYAFYSAKIREVHGGRNVEHIGQNAFYRTNRLIMHVTYNTPMYHYAIENNIEYLSYEDDGTPMTPDQEL